ncbi:DNA photolyase phr1 [Neophaeococcomyces mojaviensis]|uniref:DNA photolyase phr1 n=1 Tax=Neophaeococcomyces mojaviensis TaxID=3383035 RepID=A0ACC3AGZ5_9EURO|nr:DNA photolyase phr1 [Knufia sp. JES_112]
MPATKRKIETNIKQGEDVDVKEERAASPSAKRRRTGKPDYSDRSRYKDSKLEEEVGIIQREFYPPEMSNERANMYATGEIERPITTLTKAIKETQIQRDKIDVGDAVIHWYKTDLRLRDNKSLHLASEKAKSKGVPLICLYLISPQDFRAHCTAAVRVDFMLRNLKLLKENFAESDIPLYVETIEKRRNLPGRLIELCKEWGAKHVYCNIEYEVDELRREAQLTRKCLNAGISFNAVHDTCIVDPGELTTAAGGALSVYSPWHRKWCKYINDHPDALKEFPAASRNPVTARQKFQKLFEQAIPDAPEDKSLTAEEHERFSQLWPVGGDEAMNRLTKFISERIKKYHTTRNLPAGDGTSILSPHLAVGALASRTCVREALEASPVKKLTDDRQQGCMMWIGEVAWRDFYRHVLCNWPFVCMNKCFKPEYTNIEWEYNQDHFKAWVEGKTGFPIVDAAMRQVKHMAYMHNRCRMVVASFLAKDLMLDWRMGERFFMEHLIDGDFASNSGGWGFSASCGVDPQPYFRIFNPLLQSEKFDEQGDYIRKWVPELRDVKGKAIHDPYNRGAEAIAKKNGYPKPIVDHKMARERCLERYKRGIGRSTA